MPPSDLHKGAGYGTHHVVKKCVSRDVYGHQGLPRLLHD